MANIFPRALNWLPLQIIVCGGALATLVVAGVWYYFTPKYTRVGYMPTQPVPFSHEIHVNQLGMDCRYCHTHVEVAAHSNVPTTQTCMNCHMHLGVAKAAPAAQGGHPKLAAVWNSWESGEPIEWIRIHQAPDYVYFNHAVHVNRGVSCASCHGPVNRMEVVWHDQPQSMGWCLECHRAPENHVRPIGEVYNLDWEPGPETTQREIGLKLVEEWKVNPPVNCQACHR